ncbi:MAG TPA: hypothetical protein DEO40_02920 [Treponema sp.]|nr:hypothetical protein [Treponema sp.]HBB42925.1 hypothetical protein [Treponema sp.]HCA19611.1 hypothetical protein [Treponema sp.]
MTLIVKLYNIFYKIKNPVSKKIPLDIFKKSVYPIPVMKNTTRWAQNIKSSLLAYFYFSFYGFSRVCGSRSE